jgi:hypothetical protein
METMMNKKGFDCVEMKNEIQAKIYADTKDMSNEELLAYFNRPREQALFRKSNRPLLKTVLMFWFLRNEPIIQ